MTIVSLARFQFAMTTIFHYFFVPFSIGTVFVVAVMEIALRSDQGSSLPEDDQVLGEHFPLELCRWGGYWFDSRIPVRDELVGLLTVYGGHLRGAVSL